MAKKTAATAAPIVVPCHDHQHRTCLQVARINGHVKYIPLDVSEGLQVHQTSAEMFDQRFTPMVNYPAEKAVQLYLGYSQNIGATKEALDYLGLVIPVSKQEFDMATKKKVAAAAVAKPAEEKRATARRATNGKATPTKATPTKAGCRATDPVVKAPKAKAAPAKAANSEKRESAAQMFQDLIMAGKLTDDQIFEKVQEKFGLDEKKRGYVKWYRNHLKKQGKNPTEAKVAHQ